MCVSWIFQSLRARPENLPFPGFGSKEDIVACFDISVPLTLTDDFTCGFEEEGWRGRLNKQSVPPNYEWCGGPSWNAECTPRWGPARRRPMCILSMSKQLSLRLLPWRSRGITSWPLIRAAATGARASRAANWKIRPYTLTGRSAFAVHRRRTWLRGQGSRTWCERPPRPGVACALACRHDPAAARQLAPARLSRRARLRHMCAAYLPGAPPAPHALSLAPSIALSLALFLS